MKTISQLFLEALRKRRERHFQYFYLAIDVHGTLFYPSKQTKIDQNGSETILKIDQSDYMAIYPWAIPTLQILTQTNSCKLILWTSTKSDRVNVYRKYLEKNGVKVAYVNENPDFIGNEYSDFSRKFCFDLLLDDKAGFDPENDWHELFKLVTETDWESFYKSIDSLVNSNSSI